MFVIFIYIENEKKQINLMLVFRFKIYLELGIVSLN